MIRYSTNHISPAGDAPPALGGLSYWAVLAVLFGFGWPVCVWAAEAAPTQQYSGAANSHVVINGTSTLHNWTVNGGVLNGTVEVSGQWNNAASPAVEIKSIDLTIPVDSLKSTEGGGMDNTMYDALHRKDHPAITYHLIKAALTSSPSKQDPDYHFTASGQLTVSGNARRLDLDLSVLPEPNGQLTVTTQTKLKMTDYGVQPPTAMFGMIRSGNDVTIKATWRLTPTSAGQH
jgi:polyisoprenoid-binding protein YceI